MANKDSQLHIVMLPWLAFGHMIPYMKVAKHIARKGHRISFVSAPRNIDRLPRLPPDVAPLISYVKIPLLAVDKLPKDAEATSDLPYDKVQYLKIAYDLLQEPFTRFLESSNPDWILFDFAPYWAGPIASKLGIKSVFFTIINATTLGFLGPISALMGEDYRQKPEDYTVAPKWVPFPTKVAFRYFEIKKIFDVVSGNDSGVSDLYRFGAGQAGVDVIALRSSYEVEPEWIQVIESFHNKPVYPMGQLPPIDEEVEENTDTWRSIKEWLDKQAKASVVYVAFGSEAKLSQEELTEIALGLEQSGLPFFWALKIQLGSADSNPVHLPDSFEERVKGRGVVCTSWAPQLRILSHETVGGFLTHSGWSSVVELLSFEKPLVLLPFLADQGTNARLLEERKIGYPIPKKEIDGTFTREDVAESLRLVLVKDEGKIYRDKAKEMRAVFGDNQIQERYVDGFLTYLKAQRPIRTQSHE